MASKYAATTTVSIGNSRNEIETTLTKHGASDIVFGTIRGHVVIGFEHSGRQVRYAVPLPDATRPDFTRTPTGLVRSPAEAKKVHDQAIRSTWRAMGAVIKAKLIAIDARVSTFEAEWGWSIVLPDGQTVGSTVAPAVERAYQGGAVSPALGIEG